MPILSIALMGLFAFSGTAGVPVEAPTTAIESETVAPNAAIALKDAAVLSRQEAGTELSVLMTSYNAVPEQTDGNPHVTASGASTNPEVIAAVSKDLRYGALPFGTVIAIERDAADSENCGFSKVEHLIGYRVIADAMHSRKTNQIDVLLDQTDAVVVRGKEMNPSLALGMCSGVTVRVVGEINIRDIPSTQEELRKLVEGDKVAVNR